MMPPCKYYERGSRVLDAGICLVVSYPLSMNEMSIIKKYETKCFRKW